MGMGTQEWEDRLDEVEKDAQLPGRRAPLGDLFRPAKDGTPLSQRQSDTLRQWWTSKRRETEAGNNAI